MQNDTIFRVYSMTKPVTGVAMMMLYEECKWRLDDPVSRYIPEFARLKVYTGKNEDGCSGSIRSRTLRSWAWCSTSPRDDPPIHGLSRSLVHQAVVD